MNGLVLLTGALVRFAHSFLVGAEPWCGWQASDVGVIGRIRFRQLRYQDAFYAVGTAITDIAEKKRMVRGIDRHRTSNVGPGRKILTTTITAILNFMFRHFIR